MMQAEESRLSCCKGGLHDRWMDKRRKLVAAVESVLARGVEAGTIRRDVPLEVLANVLMGMLRTRDRSLAGARRPCGGMKSSSISFAVARGPAAAWRKKL